jgi:hypothetical protein
VVLAAFRRYGHRSFKIDLKGWRLPAIRLADSKGWMLVIEDRGSVTELGRQAVAEHWQIKLEEARSPEAG